MGSAARSATSGLVLVAKACGYDIARCMTFHLILFT
jgi:mevalonate pyrophosphate decarboxylase